MTALTAYPFTATGAPTARTLPTRLAEVVNVKDYGATGDGTTDDFDAIIAAYTWNNEFLTTTVRAYSGAFRIVDLTWAGGTVTAVLNEAHGWVGTASVLLELSTTPSGPQDVAVLGNKTVTVVNATTISWAEIDPTPMGFLGCVRPQVTGTTTWAANTVTVVFSEAHRLITGLTCTVAGFADATINGSRVITVVNSTTITFTVTGSGTISTNGTVKPVGLLTFAASSVPATITNTGNWFLAGVYPSIDGAYFGSTVNTITGATTITLSSPLLADIPISTDVRIQNANRGKIWFPPGEYNIGSNNWDLTDANLSAVFEGSPGVSIITGDVAGYLLDRDLKSAQSGACLWQFLTLINTNATGGGLRFSELTSGAHNLRVESHFGICTTGNDYNHAPSFCVAVSGCILTPGAHVSGSIGLQLSGNGQSIYSNYIDGFDTGATFTQFGITFKGNYVVNCLVAGLDLGRTPQNTTVSNSITVVRGNILKNNAIGIYSRNFGGTLEGNYIEGGADATYGLRSDSSLFSLVRGMEVSGTFATDAVNYQVQSVNIQLNPVRSVRATKSGAASFVQPTSSNYITLSNCNVAPVYTFANVLGRGVASGSWSAGTMTLVMQSTPAGITTGLTIIVEGLVTSGVDANGIFVATVSGSNISYSLVGNPGTVTASKGSVTTIVAGSAVSPIKTLSWLSNVATVETWGFHNLNPGATAVIAGVTGATTYNATVTGLFTITSPTTFTFALVGDPGAPGNIAASVAASTPSTARLTTGRVNVSQRPNAWQSLTCNISDGAKVGGGAAAIGDYVQGSGSGHYQIIWTKNGWMRSG